MHPRISLLHILTGVEGEQHCLFPSYSNYKASHLLMWFLALRIHRTPLFYFILQIIFGVSSLSADSLTFSLLFCPSPCWPRNKTRLVSWTLFSSPRSFKINKYINIFHVIMRSRSARIVYVSHVCKSFTSEGRNLQSRKTSELPKNVSKHYWHIGKPVKTGILSSVRLSFSGVSTSVLCTNLVPLQFWLNYKN